MADIKRPLKIGARISQYWGENPEIYKKFNLASHNGIDYAIAEGTPIISAQDGIVKEVDYDKNGYGNYIRIENDRFGTLYAHLKDTKVNIGYVIKQGETIGFSGNTGFSTGPHLHFGVYLIPRDYSNGFNGYVNPLIYMDKETEGIMPDTGTQKYSDEYVQQLEKDRMQFWQQRDEEIQKNSQLKTDLEELQKKFDESFKLLTEIDDLGFKNIDEIKKVAVPYKEMYDAGYKNLQDIKDGHQNLLNQLQIYIDQVKERDAQISKIKESVNTQLTPVEEITINPQPEPPGNTFWSRLVGLFFKLLDNLRRNKQKVDNLEPIPAEEVKEVLDTWKQFSDMIRGY